MIPTSLKHSQICFVFSSPQSRPKSATHPQAIAPVQPPARRAAGIFVPAPPRMENLTFTDSTELALPFQDKARYSAPGVASTTFVCLLIYTPGVQTGGPMAGNPYKLYGRANAGSLAPQIVLEEIGAPYEMIWVSKSPADVAILRKVNPAGKVPALVLPDGTSVFESAAILIHLTHAYPAANLAPPAGSTAHARFLQWMLFLSSSVYESCLRSYYAERYSTSGPDAA